jgi:pimeloyl-ACP methyl ester carboxylesterase
LGAVEVTTAQGITLGCERSGSGPPLFMIMGLSGTRHQWNEVFLAELRDGFELITYDHRGIGRSSPAEEPFTMADLARDAAALLDALQLESAHVLGISMGGMVAQELALARPELVRTLTLGCTYCGGAQSVRTSPEVLGRLAAGMASGVYEVAVRAMWEVNVSPAFAADRQMWERFLASGREHRVAREVIMLQFQAIAAHDTSERLGELALPALAIHGSVDQMVDVANGRLIASLIPGCGLEIMDGVGHLFFWEEPVRSAQLVREHALVRV